MKMLSRTKPASTACGLILFFAGLFMTGCSTYPDWFASSGPSAELISEVNEGPTPAGIQIVDLTADVAHRLLSNENHIQFSQAFGDDRQAGYVVGPGDVIELSLWEAPPAMLFDTSSGDMRQGASTAKATNFPEQMVNSDGAISVPFAGQIVVAGKTPLQIETEIVGRLAQKANQPQALIRVVKNYTANVTVVGEVTTSTRMPLTARGERLLDALAAAGGVRQGVNKITLQLTRQDQVASMALDAVIRDPKQNIQLQPGDVITALYQPLSFTVLGATGKNLDIDFEATGLSLAQAFGRAGGLFDTRADAKGVFVFRFEPLDALDWPTPPATTPDGKVPVVYRVNLKNPATFLVSQSFPMQNKDVMYVANAPSAELQKFLNLVLTATYPFLNMFNTGILPKP
ncbi:MAG: polysaccharide export protein [Methylococcales bacterium]|nr:polysaccharide export protein [Methylococcales bacterium]